MRYKPLPSAARLEGLFGQAPEPYLRAEGVTVAQQLHPQGQPSSQPNGFDGTVSALKSHTVSSVSVSCPD
jgi:hypothetical protein